MFRSLAQELEARIPSGGALPGTGELLVAAVIDERDGAANAVPSLVEWLTNPSRFSPDWARAVREAVRMARGAIR